MIKNKKVKKTLKILTPLVVVLFISSFFIYPYFVGKIIEESFKGVEESFKQNKNINPASSFERSYFSSKGTLSIDLPFELAKIDQAGSLKTSLEGAFNHLFLTSSNKLIIQGFKELGIENPLEILIKGNYGPLAGIHHEFKVADINLEATPKRPSSLEAKGVKASLTLGRDFSFKKISFDIPHLLKREGVMEYKIDNLQSLFYSSSDWGKIDSGLSLSFDSVSSLEQNFGPGVLDLTLRNIDAKAYQDLKPILGSFLKNSSNQAALIQVAIKAMRVLPRLLSLAPILEISRLNFNTPKGELMGHAAFQLKKDDDVNFSNVLDLFNAIVDLRAPKGAIHEMILQYQKVGILMKANLLTSTPEQQKKVLDKEKDKMEKEAQELIKKYIAQGHLKEEGNFYSFMATYQQRKLLLNGKAINFGELMPDLGIPGI